jgi:hypothetical protein
MDLVDCAVAPDHLSGLERQHVSVLLAVQLDNDSRQNQPLAIYRLWSSYPERPVGFSNLRPPQSSYRRRLLSEVLPVEEIGRGVHHWCLVCHHSVSSHHP